jgi:thiamine-monophosphate kinase
VHFRRSYFTPEEVGHKALAVNISDLAACGAEPLAFTLGLGLPPDAGMAWLERMFQGMAALAGRFRMGLAGGDLSRADCLHLSLTVWGEAASGAEGAKAGWLSRQGTKLGDTLFLVGEIGLARLGLRLLERGGRAALSLRPAAGAAHLRPLPKVAEGRALARFAGRGVALMDLSDGLARDLPRLLRGLGADIVLPESLLHEEVLLHARSHGADPAQEAFLGGEDYALLGSAPPELFPELLAVLPQLREIGRVTEKTLRLNGKAVTKNGFDHFGGGRHDDAES